MHNYHLLLGFICALADVILVISVILTFFLFYELSLAGIRTAEARWVVYIFILFSAEVVALLFCRKTSDFFAHMARLLLVTVGFVFAVILTTVIKKLVSVSNIPFNIAVTITVFLGVLMVIELTSACACMKKHFIHRMMEEEFESEYRVEPIHKEYEAESTHSEHELESSYYKGYKMSPRFRRGMK